MKPEAQAQAIARVMDWEYYEETREMAATYDGDIIGYSWPSLDAMHEAEKVLTPMNVPDYVEWLREIESSSDDFSDLVHAEAKKKAEAFLRTLNLWTE